MQKRIPIKNHIQEIHLITTRAIMLFVIMCALTCLLIARLGYLQLSQHDVYTTLSKKNWLDLAAVEPTRGLIYDRNGVLLAENVPVFSLDVTPYKIQNIPKTLSDIAKIIPLTDIEIAQFQKQLKQHRRFDQIPLKLRLSEEEVAKFSENQYRFPGVMIKARLMRHYPFEKHFTHVLGYVGRINSQELNDLDLTNYSASNYIGKLGIEKYYEDELHGTVGYEQVENDASGEAIRTLSQIKPLAGENLYLTIDSKLQLAAEQALDKHRGAIVAIDPKTGQILALVSEPTYDPNLFVAGISSQDFKQLQESPDRPLYNRALRGLYPMASTIKPFLGLQGLNTEAVDIETSIFDPGWFQLKNSERVFRDWKRRGHGTVNLSKAITVSCDTYFYELGMKLGIQRIGDILNQFGYGQLTGIDIGEELPGVVASPAWKKRVKRVSWYPGDTVNSSIGQGFMQTTPLQLAVATATLANRGKHFTPYLVLSEQEPGKKIIEQKPTLNHTVKMNDSRSWDIIINAMKNVALSPEGTAYRYFGNKLPYTIAMKTGTAQISAQSSNHSEDEADDQSKLPEHLRDHHILIAFAPAEDPKIAIAVVIENSKLATSIARKFLDYYLAGIPIPLPEEDNKKTVPTSSATVVSLKQKSSAEQKSKLR